VYTPYTMLKRTQVYIDSEQRKELGRIAKRRGTTVSHLVRQGIASVIESESRVPGEQVETIMDLPEWKRLEELWAAEDPNAPTTYGSTTYKQILYGGERPWPESL
jgi:hypothetical protein